MRELISSFDDSRLDDYRNLPDARLRGDSHLFIAESRFIVSRLLRSRRFTTKSLLVTHTAAGALTELLDEHPGVPVYEVDQHTMNRVTGLPIHRGCLAIGERGAGVAPATLTTGGTRLVALERVANPDNVGGIFRSAAAFGVDGVLLDRSTSDPLYRKALRTSMGAALHVPFACTAGWTDTLAHARQSGLQVVALTPDPSAPPVAQVAASLRRKRVLLVVGHEGDGLTESTLAECDVRARIPMHAGVDSLNVATATAIALYEFDHADR